jgi:hypothetical protein
VFVTDGFQNPIVLMDRFSSGTLERLIPFFRDAPRTLPLYFYSEIDEPRTTILHETPIPPFACCLPIQCHNFSRSIPFNFGQRKAMEFKPSTLIFPFLTLHLAIFPSLRSH